MSSLIKQALKKNAKASDEDVNLTDVNGAPSSMDEDGELADSADTSEAVNTPPDDEAEDSSAEDSTPVIHKLTVICYHPAGSAEQHTDISGEISGSAGLQRKRLVLTGSKTARQVAEALLGIGGW